MMRLKQQKVKGAFLTVADGLAIVLAAHAL
jgi:hypothetical protein